MAHGSLTLFHVRGIPVRAHWTLLLILPYLAVVLSLQFDAIARHAGVMHAHLVLPPLVWGAVLALGLFASVGLHELAHSLLAIRFGGRVKSITLMLLGGVSELVRIPRRPASEATMALAGPLTSFALGGLLLLMHRVVAGPEDLRMGLFYLAEINLAIGFFNLLPAFPMDGGRVLRALLSTYWSPARATEIAASVGRGLSVVMALVGLWTGNFLLLLIAVFVFFGAGVEAAGERMRTALEGLRLLDLSTVFRRPPPAVLLDTPISDVLPLMREAGRLELIAVDERGAPKGVVHAADLAQLPHEAVESMRLRDLGPVIGARAVVLPWDMTANDALERAEDSGAEDIVVVDPRQPAGRELVGLVASREIESSIVLRVIAERQKARRGAAGRRPVRV